ncbi:MAG: hypothetical protein O2971_18455 [Proteobacteria bacterium]|nr:hypothetical protein [Pseudomonadota bacterium]
MDEYESELSSLDLWRLCDELTIVQAALLLSGLEPSGNQDFVEHWEPHKRPPGYEAAKAALTRALKRGDIDGEIAPHYDTDINGHIIGPIDGTIDLQQSVLEVASVKNWLGKRGISTGFFFAEKEDFLDFLDTKHPRYSPKLAASVSAWFAIDSEESLNGKSPKSALERWLRENAADYGLSDEEGKPNEKGIEECAKVANWQTKGGAPKTPGA